MKVMYQACTNILILKTHSKSLALFDRCFVTQVMLALPFQTLLGFLFLSEESTCPSLGHRALAEASSHSFAFSLHREQAIMASLFLRHAQLIAF